MSRSLIGKLVGRKFPENEKTNGNIIRAGVIPKITYNGITLYAFGIDLDTSIICDFGGHIDPQDKDLIETAMREFDEETHGCFGLLSRDQVKRGTFLRGHDSVEYIVELVSDHPPSHYNTLFARLASANQKTREISDILWLSKKQLLRIIKIKDESVGGFRGFHPHAIYRKVHSALSLNIDKL